MVVNTGVGVMSREADFEENVGLGCAMDMFSEYEEVLSIIENIKNVYNSQRLAEKSYERFTYVLDKYQEQPHLLDPYLEQILNNLVTIVRNSESDISLKHEAFKYLYSIMKVRGYKAVVRLLPHEVSDIEPILQLLESQDPKDFSTWQTRYVLLLWLSIIVLIPFHMSRLDSFESGDKHEYRKTVMERILDTCKNYVLNFEHCHVTAYLASRFLTRSDVKDVHLASFLDWSCKLIVSEDSTSYQVCAALALIAAVLKHGKRGDLLPYAPMLLGWILASKYRNSDNMLLRKFGIKVVQRIGLTFLKPRLAVWRYDRGSRSLAANLSAGDHVPRGRPPPGPTQLLEEGGEDADIPEAIEEVVEELIQCLKDKDTVIRWSAAKGVGRVTGRLPRELADQVVGSVLELLSPRETDSAWHGGCLALAELGRRGLLLPQRLPDVVPLVLRALVYDEPRGYTSVGAHIRDAACYVCWAFARAYDTEVLHPFVKDIAGSLLEVAVFDREINCRRAASAAFQENVGRQGTFPHGIDILTTADYYAVGVRTNAFLNISVYIAQYEEYTERLINHLVERKVNHWDSTIRELSAKALHNLTPKAPSYMIDTVLPALLSKTFSIELNVRHGAILALAEVLHALSLVAKDSNQNTEQLIGTAVLQAVRDLVPQFRARGQFRGLSGELMKQACCLLVEKGSLAALPFHGQEVVNEWQALLDECLLHEVPVIRDCACSALPAFFTQYYQLSDPVNLDRRDVIVRKYTQHLSATQKPVRMGYAMALGSFPKFMLEDQLHVIVPALVQCSHITQETLKWAESRQDAIKALTLICKTVGTSKVECRPHATCYTHVRDLMEVFLTGMTEYTMDSRGDIGAWVRESSMTGLQALVGEVVKSDPSLLTEDMVLRTMESVMQQAVERIDRTRAHAGKVFAALLHSEPAMPHMLYRDELLKAFPCDVCNQMNWSAACDTFPRFTQLLVLEPYTRALLAGFCYTVGGLSESLVRHAGGSLLAHLASLQGNRAELARLSTVILSLLETHIKDDRVALPVVATLDRLLSAGVLSPVLQEFAPELLRLTKALAARSSDVARLGAALNLFCQLVQVSGEVSRRSLTQLSIFLCNRLLHIRKVTASRLYESLMLYGDETPIPPENMDEVLTLISDTNWELEVPEIKPIRNRLCELMNVPIPKPTPPAKK